MINISLQGDVTLKKRLTKDRKKKWSKGLFMVVTFFESEAKRNIVKNKSRITGRLQQSIQNRKLAPLKFNVNTPLKYATYVEYGRKAVKPKKKKFLFIPQTLKATKQGWSSSLVLGKDYLLAKKVKAAEAKPFFEPAKKLTKKKAKSILIKYLDV